MRALLVLLLLPACAPLSLEKAENMIELAYFEGCVSSHGHEPVVQVVCQMHAHEWRKGLSR